MTSAITIIEYYRRTIRRMEPMLDRWLLGLFARFVFLAVLVPYYVNSALTKFDGPFSIADSAYYQIALPAVDAAGGDVSAVSFFPWGLMVFVGSYGEIILPLLLVAGLFTRMAALGMIAFIVVQSLTDILVHNVDAGTIGALFDRFPDSVILDQRLLWIFPLAYLAVKGAGMLSLDKLLCTIWTQRMAGHEKSGRLSPTA
ncbi:DoxX family protein [Rhizobium rosettiformans]|uniref:DoxX family protein n=1 Tax=Rhizobium rosettiformans TaxID=1368430 RepID=A0ABX7F3B9_9HYPH|nr:DoxX family protein [Rhizobium rosettiformans]QRF53871.1 DoxX family protein [Rhizobium rosettiformans]